MARTKRSKTTSWLRRMAHKQTLAQEAAALDEADTLGFNLGSRQKVRANPKSGAIPNPWDDYRIAAEYETDFHRQKRFPR